MNIRDFNNIYFIGIGGIGMSAIARFFLMTDKQVSGYDKTPSAITSALNDLGVSIHFEDRISAIESSFLNPQNTLVVYTPAIPEEHIQFNYFKTNHFRVLKRSEVLGLITEETICLAVAGTHGKTTTTSILAHLLYECHEPITAFLGGISENYNSNYISNGTKISVVEADEFDRSFLTLSPDIACITSMDADHLDIYGDATALKNTFNAFTKKLKPQGQLFVKNGLPLSGITYGLEDDSDFSAHHIRINNGVYVFDLVTPDYTFQNLSLALPGRHNLSNAVAALAMALSYGCKIEALSKALVSYKGVKRRFTYHIKRSDFVYIDDYAHHPEEILAVYDAVREMYGNQKTLVIFQPHLYSRTQDFVRGFADALAKFDEVLLLDIYPAREQPIKGVTSQWLLGHINNNNKKLIQKSDIVEEIKTSNAKIVLTMGAGDIGEEVKHIKTSFSVA